MADADFALRNEYHSAVRAVGWLTLQITRRIRETDGGRRLELP
jgi:hypothetical protein